MSEISFSTAETAKMIRVALKAKFPGVKFSIRSKSYAGGSSINVNWIDGPTSKAVEEITDPYQGKGFDGSIDMAYYKDSIMLADGTVTYGPTGGTEGSMGYVQASKPKLPEGAKIVHFYVSYIFAERGKSPEAVKKALVAVVEKFGNQIGLPEDLSEAVKVSEWSGEGYIDPAFGDKDVTGERGWNLHWSLGYKVGEALQNMAF
jgi:hypothetical protein